MHLRKFATHLLHKKWRAQESTPGIVAMSVVRWNAALAQFTQIKPLVAPTSQVQSKSVQVATTNKTSFTGNVVKFVAWVIGAFAGRFDCI